MRLAGEGSKNLFRHQKTFAEDQIKIPTKMKTQRVKKTCQESQHVRKVRYRLCGRRSTFARSGADFATGAALSQGQISRQARHFRKVRYRFCKIRSRFHGRRSTFARSGTDFASGAARSQGTVQGVCGRRTTFASDEEKDTEKETCIKRGKERERERERERKKERKKERERKRKEDVKIGCYFYLQVQVL